MPPYADPEVRRRVNREALRRRRAAERRERANGNGRADPEPPPLNGSSQWRAPVQPSPAPPPCTRPVYYRVLPAQPRVRSVELPPLPVVVLILVVAAVWIYAHHQSGDEIWDPLG